MISICDSHQPTRADWRFQFLAVPVRVQIFFWLSVALLASGRETGMAFIWIGVSFVSILIHEMGHALAMRIYGERPEVILFGFGGLARPLETRHYSLRTRAIIAFAGPAAGFAVAALAAAVTKAMGGDILFSFSSGLPVLSASLFSEGVRPSFTLLYQQGLLNDLLWINFYWGVINLMPVYPLDGGQMARAIWKLRDPFYGWKKAMYLSAVISVLIAGMAFLTQNFYLVLLFGLLAAGSLQAIEAEKPMYKPYRGWDR